jgi:hypothetical protein
MSQPSQYLVHPPDFSPAETRRSGGNARTVSRARAEELRDPQATLLPSGHNLANEWPFCD